MEDVDFAIIEGLECIQIVNNNVHAQSKSSACGNEIDGFCTENAGGDLYSPRDTDEVRSRASNAGKRFFSVFGQNA